MKQTAVEWYAEEFAEHLEETYGIKITNLTLLHKAKEMEKEQKIKMLNTFLCNTQMGEDVEDVEAWFKQYEKQQEQVKKELINEEIPESFFKPVLGEPIWNIRTK
jgi:hypothetical protein